MKEQKSAIEELKVIVEGRTRYEGQKPDLLDRLYSEIKQLKEENLELLELIQELDAQLIHELLD